MKIASFTSNGESSWGIVSDGLIQDAGRLLEVQSLRSALERFTLAEIAQAAHRARSVELGAARLLPPVPDAGKVLCIGLNYADHIAEMHRETPSKPTVFTRFNDSLVGDGSSLIAPRNSARFDFEGEFAVVIGRGGRHIRREDALDHVFGYTLLNDGSLRDYQRHTTQFTPGKNFPASGGFGPWIVTSDEFGPVGRQRIVTTVNEVVTQESTLDQLVFGVPDLISYISEWTPLSPGDVIATGTPGGVGDGREPALYLFPGDVVTVTVDGIGTLTNPVAEEL